MKIYQTLLIFILAITLSSCGLMFNPTHEKVFFNSKPTSMSVLINDSLYGNTPLLVSLSQKEDYDIKYRSLDSIVYSDSIKSSFNIKYCLYDLIFPPAILVDALDKTSNELDKNCVYYNYYQNDTTEIAMDSSKIVKTIFKDEEAKREQAIRLETNHWNIHLSNGEVKEEYKILDLRENYLICTIGNLYDNDTNDFRNIVYYEPKKSYFVVDSIDKIVYANEMTGKEQILNTMLGIAIGAGIGLGAAFILVPNPIELAVYLHVFSSAGGGFLGGLWGLFYDSSEYKYYSFKNKNYEQKYDLLNQLLLMK